MDAGFALLVFLVLAALAAEVSSLLGALLPDFSEGSVVFYSLVALPTYAIQIKATLGLRTPSRPVWGPLINGAVIGFSITTLAFDAVVVWQKSLTVIASIAVLLLGMIADGAVVVFQFRRSGYPGSTSASLRIKCALLGGVFFLVGTFLGIALAPRSWGKWLPSPPLFVTLIAFALPAALVVWPMFRLLAPTFGIIDTSVPLWRRIARSPWWATPAMLLVGMIWHVGGSPLKIWPFANAYPEPDVILSLWPLALPIAAYFWHRHGSQALAPILLGTLPLIFRLGSNSLFEGSGHNFSLTPGGVWPAIAIPFLARFAGDRAFRERVLRREHVSWGEAVLVLALLAGPFDLTLFNIAEFTDPKSSQGGVTEPTDIDLTLRIASSFMLATAAFVIGASRMPAAPFVTVVIGAWLLQAISPSRAAWSMAVSPFALQIGDAVSALLVLYGARAWRTYAAIGTGAAAGLTDLPDRQLAHMKRQGLLLSCAATVMVAILLSGFAPAIDLSFAQKRQFIPDAFGTLALVLLTGLIATDLWCDRFSFSGRVSNQFIQLASRTIYVPVVAAVVYLTLARAFGTAALATLGLGIRELDLSRRFDLGSIGFAVCVIASFALGIALRIIGERRVDELWFTTAFRLLTAPGRVLPSSLASQQVGARPQGGIGSDGKGRLRSAAGAQAEAPGREPEVPQRIEPNASQAAQGEQMSNAQPTASQVSQGDTPRADAQERTSPEQRSDNEPDPPPRGPPA
jgi:hypothetical protein